MSTIKFPTEEDRKSYWKKHKPDGAPNEVDDAFLDYIESKLVGESWNDFTERIKSVNQNFERAADVTRCIYGSEKLFLGDSTDGIRSVFDELLANVAPIWRGTPSVGIDTWVRWCQLAGIFSFFPISENERSSEFVWSRARCFIAGAGYENFKTISEEIIDSYPGCPFDPDETKEEWDKNLLKAHSNSGWPAQLAYLPWKSLVRDLGSNDEQPALWLRMLSLLHVLKHARVSDSQGVITHFGGTSTIIPEERTNAIGTWNAGKSAMLAALGSRLPGGRTKIPLATRALQSILGHLDINHLLRKESLASLPANILAGPWTMPVPDHSAHGGFYQTGLRMAGIWAATNGVVQKETMTQAEVLKYDWNCKNPASYNDTRKLFSRGLPETYSECWPSDVFLDAFPNFDASWAPGDELNLAVKTLLDVPIAASLIRSVQPEFLYEYPAIVFMPSNPSPTDSTNQGKSQATLVYAKAINPAISRLVSINDSSSAPDIRTVAGEIRSTGSIAVDEFRPPRNSTHIFAHDNMQALCTGSGVASGRVYENEGTVCFRCSPVLSAKVYEVPPDIQNRSITHWLGSLTDAMRARSNILSEIQNGSLSLRMRLGMHAFLEKTDILAKYRSEQRQSSSRGLRFDAHRTLAATILQQKTNIPLERAYALLDKAYSLMQDKLRLHVQSAVDSGLVASMEYGSALRLRANYLFDDMTPDEFNKFRQQLSMSAASRAEGIAGGVTAKEILLGWGVLHNMEHRPFQDYLQIITGAKRHVSNRAVCMALKASLHELMPTEGAQWFLPGVNGTVNGWIMKRGKEDMIHFECLHPGGPK